VFGAIPDADADEILRHVSPISINKADKEMTLNFNVLGTAAILRSSTQDRTFHYWVFEQGTPSELYMLIDARRLHCESGP
jgi:hypothetical protein